MAKQSYVSAASTNATLVNGGDTRLMYVSGYNKSASTAVVRFYAGGGSTKPTAGSGVPVWRLYLPAGGGAVEALHAAGSVGPTFRNGLGFTITAGFGDSDTTATGANDVVLNVWWE